jgi:hypothetical protein
MATSRPQTNVSQGTMPQPRQRILRIGVLLGGKIIEERLIRERTSVTIGQSMRNTFSVPLEGLPLEFTLFSLHENRYALRFLQSMDGRLSDGGNVFTLDALKGRGAAQRGDYWEVPLSETSRGKLSFGDLTVLFQFVTEPPRQPKPMLPASVRGTFADRFDPRLSVILGASIILHFAIVIVALVQDREVDDTMGNRAYTMAFKQETIEVKQQDIPKPDVGSAAGPGSAAAPKPEIKDTTPKPPKDNPKPGTDADKEGRDKAARDAQLAEDAVKLADGLTAEGTNGTTEADMSRRRPGTELGKQLNEVKNSGQEVKVGGGAGRGSRDNGDPRVGTGNGPKINGPGGTETAGGPKEEKAPTGRISVADKQTFDESSLTPDIVLSKIQSAYMAGLKRCYKEYLKKDASARGKVTLSLTVNETGRTVKGAAKGFASEVDSCIGNQMSSWRFPVPKDKDGEATEASFAITLQLVPD